MLAFPATAWRRKIASRTVLKGFARVFPAEVAACSINDRLKALPGVAIRVWLGLSEPACEPFLKVVDDLPTPWPLSFETGSPPRPCRPLPKAGGGGDDVIARVGPSAGSAFSCISRCHNLRSQGPGSPTPRAGLRPLNRCSSFHLSGFRSRGSVGCLGRCIVWCRQVRLPRKATPLDESEEEEGDRFQVIGGGGSRELSSPRPSADAFAEAMVRFCNNQHRQSLSAWAALGLTSLAYL